MQSDSTTVSHVRTPLDVVIDEFPETSNRLCITAPIIVNPPFVNAINKLQTNNVRGLLPEETIPITGLMTERVNREVSLV